MKTLKFVTTCIEKQYIWPLRCSCFFKFMTNQEFHAKELGLMLQC